MSQPSTDTARREYWRATITTVDERGGQPITYEREYARRVCRTRQSARLRIKRTSGIYGPHNVHMRMLAISVELKERE